ncbi:MAG: sulfatase-like hydrolase/transferase [Candidatus Rariloculaceae bacterium]
MRYWLVFLTVFGLSIPAAYSQENRRPNILYIVADDLGFTDIGAFGSEISTPNLDALAYEGVRLTNFHTDRSCQATRTMLMTSTGTGRSLQLIGNPMSGRRGHLLRQDWAILPEFLQDAGYTTFMTGKWDLGIGENYTPHTRGFDRSFVLLDASASHFAEKFWEDPTPYRDEGVIVTIDDLPENFYSTEYYTDKMIEYLQAHGSDEPWFAYVPYTAPHWPLQLPDAWLDRYAGRYDEGYDVLREERMVKAEELGVLPPNADPDSYTFSESSWATLSAEDKVKHARAQEIYAGMVEYMDMSVGRLVDYLEQSGQIDDTVIMFSSDHGGSDSAAGLVEGAQTGNVPNLDRRVENYGRKRSYIDHGPGFASASTAPLKGYKGMHTEGGLTAAAFLWYPAQILAGTVNNTYMTVMDVLPTFLEIAETEHPGASEYKGRQIKGIVGRSFWPHLIGEADLVHPPTDITGWVNREFGALIRGNFKLVNGESLNADGVSPWQLYDLSIDRGETRDISAEHPELTAELAAEWQENWSQR